MVGLCSLQPQSMRYALTKRRNTRGKFGTKRAGLCSVLYCTFAQCSIVRVLAKTSKDMEKLSPSSALAPANSVGAGAVNEVGHAAHVGVVAVRSAAGARGRIRSRRLRRR